MSRNPKADLSVVLHARIPQDFINQLLEQIDLADVIAERIPLEPTGREYRACCPFHDDTTPSFTVTTEKGFYHCFGCQAHGNAITFLMQYDGLGFRQAVAQLTEQAGLPLPQADNPVAATPALPALAQAQRFFRSQLSHKRGSDYLQQRGIDPAIAERYQLGYAPAHWQHLLTVLNVNYGAETLRDAGLVVQHSFGHYYDRFRDRLIFPIRDEYGNLVGFGGRALDDDAAKYLNSPDAAWFHKSQQLYGLYEALQQNASPTQLVVVEGYLDVLSLAQHGIDYGVAMMGTGLSDTQIKKLMAAASEIVFCFDGDAAGQRASQQALHSVLPFISDSHRFRFVVLPDQYDPDNFIRHFSCRTFLQCLKNARTLDEYLIATLTGDEKWQTIEGRAQRLGDVLERINPAPQSHSKSRLLRRVLTYSDPDAVLSITV